MDVKNMLTTLDEEKTGKYILDVYSDLFSLTGDAGMSMKQTLLNIPAILTAKRNNLPALDVARKVREYGVQS